MARALNQIPGGPLRALHHTAVALHAAGAYQLALTATARTHGVDPAEVTAAGRKRRPAEPTTRAHQEALYLASVTFGAPIRALARVVTSASHEAVAKAVRAVEARRDDPTVDRAIDELELEVML